MDAHSCNKPKKDKTNKIKHATNYYAHPWLLSHTTNANWTLFYLKLSAYLEIETPLAMQSKCTCNANKILLPTILCLQMKRSWIKSKTSKSLTADSNKTKITISNDKIQSNLDFIFRVYSNLIK